MRIPFRCKTILMTGAAVVSIGFCHVTVAQTSLINIAEASKPMQLDLLKFVSAVDLNTLAAQQAAKGVNVEPMLRVAKLPPLIRPALGVEVMVQGAGDGLQTEGFQSVFSARDIEESAGTFGDPSRFFSTLAGVATDNDQRNDFLVRGGNPGENLFVIDNIEIPSINQLALSDTTGGFVSMIDAAAIQKITLHDDAYSSKYDQRLSSVVDISTRTNGSVESHTEFETGIAGAGGSITRSLGQNGSYFISARQGVLQYLTNDIGMNGVPHYNNALVRGEGRIDERNSWWGLSLTGVDSIGIHPSATDGDETNPYDITYSGWRNTSGLNWEHVFSARAFGIASAAHSEQSQTVAENAQLEQNSIVYNEKSRDSISTLKYDWTFVPSDRLVVQAGARSSVDQMNYVVAQPLGLQNPYTSDPAPLDNGAINRQFATVSSGAYAEGTYTFKHGIEIAAGERFSQWSFGGHAVWSGKALVSAPVLGRVVHVSYAEHAQLPAQLYMLAFNNEHTLLPIRTRQATVGLLAIDNRRVRIKVEAYQKWYSDYPVASEYPQLSMANIADTFGQAFLMFPMVGSGTGIARGAEITAETHISSKLEITTTAAYARCWYAGLDGLLRRGNYDIPASANVTGLWSLGKGFRLSWRYNITSGRPYTPDNIPLSLAQNRDVYDLNELNEARSAAYERLDFRLEQSRKLGRGTLTWHAGLENATDHKNFYSQVWEPRPEQVFYPGATAQQFPNGFIAEQDQMPLFPDGGLKFSF
jgi:hypothetical protein